MGNKGHFTKPPSPLIRIYHFGKSGGSLLSMGFDNAAIFKSYADTIDEGSAIGKRLGGPNCSIHPVFVGDRKNFFRGDIGIADHPILGHGRTSLPHVAINKAEGEIRAGATILERSITPPI